MIYKVTYNQEYKRVIPAVLIDSRGTIPAIQTVGGYELKSYNDSQVAIVTDTVIPYKIETETGNLAGYFNVQTKSETRAVLQGYQLRPAFQQFDAEILQIITNFIASNVWQYDILL